MHSWLVRNGWVLDYSDSPVSRVFSYIAFVMMPGCLIGAILNAILFRE